MQYRALIFFRGSQLLFCLFDTVFIDKVVIAQSKAFIYDAGKLVGVNPQFLGKFAEGKIWIQKDIFFFHKKQEL